MWSLKGTPPSRTYKTPVQLSLPTSSEYLPWALRIRGPCGSSYLSPLPSLLLGERVMCCLGAWRCRCRQGSNVSLMRLALNAK